MKKIITIVFITLAFTFALFSCDHIDSSGSNDANAMTTVTVSDDGYVVVNGIKTAYKVDTEDVIEVDDNGYLVVNGVKTEHTVICNHVWNTVTTAPTCTNDGYDTKSCALCEKSVTFNKTPALEHTYSENYTFDNNYHWYKCTGCDALNGKEEHILDDDGICTVCEEPIGATPGVIYDISADGTYAEVVGYEGTATKVKISEEYEGFPVKNIYDSSFYNSAITSIVIPNSVTSIGKAAFSNCWSLMSVVISDGVANIGGGAFSGCSALIKLVIPDSITNIGPYAFDYCYELEFNTYENCNYLGTIDNPYFALINASNKNMSSYIIHSDTVIIAGGGFSGCSRLSSITIPDKVTSIGNGAFQECSSLVDVEIGKSVISIGEHSFFACNSLKNIVIPDSVECLGDYVFNNCTSMVGIVISDRIAQIGSWAFANCGSLTDVYYTGNEAEWLEIDIGEVNYELIGATIHYNYVYEE